MALEFPERRSVSRTWLLGGLLLIAQSACSSGAPIRVLAVSADSTILCAIAASRRSLGDYGPPLRLTVGEAWSDDPVGIFHVGPLRQLVMAMTEDGLKSVTARGEGPGEVLTPVDVIRDGPETLILDRGLNRVTSVEGSTLVVRRSFGLQGTLPPAVRLAPGGEIIALTIGRNAKTLLVEVRVDSGAPRVWETGISWPTLGTIQAVRLATGRLVVFRESDACLFLLDPARQAIVATSCVPEPEVEALGIDISWLKGQRVRSGRTPAKFRPLHFAADSAGTIFLTGKRGDHFIVYAADLVAGSISPVAFRSTSPEQEVIGVIHAGGGGLVAILEPDTLTAARRCGK